MHLNKLISTLKAFDGQQMKSLKSFIHSSYFKVPEGAVLMFDYLAPLHPRFAQNKVSPEMIGQTAQFLSTPAKQSRVGTELLEAVEQFIAVENWQKQRHHTALNRLNGFKELQLVGQFTKAYEEEIAQLKECPEQDVHTFFHRHLVTEFSFNGFDALVNRSSQTDILPVVQTLDEFYALKKLRYLCEARNRQQVFGNAYHEEQIPGLLKILERYTNEENPYPYLFVNVYKMMQEKTYEESNLYYQLIKKCAANQPSTILPASILESMTYAVNNCLKWYNKGYEQAGNEYLWWIEWKIKHNLLLEKDKLLPIVFRNILSIAVFSKKNPEWIDQIIKLYAPRLPEEHYETNLAFGRGLYNYALKKYKEAIRYFLLAQAKEEVVFNSIIRRWQWMSAYEYDSYDTDELLNQLDSYNRHLQRNEKQIQHLSKTFINFISYATKLVKVNKHKVDDILLDLKAEGHFPGSSWLAYQLTKKKGRTKRMVTQQSLDDHSVLSSTF